MTVRSSLALALIMVFACGDGTTETAASEIDGVPVLAEHVRGPGSDLGDGFEVPDGSHALGPVFPKAIAFFDDDGEPVEDDGWRALLLVKEDVLEVLEAIADQAVRADLPFEHARCSLVGPVSSAGESLECAALSARANGRQLNVTSVRTSGGTVFPEPVSHVIVDYTETDPTVVLPDIGGTVDFGETDLPFPSGWPGLPARGDSFGKDYVVGEPGLELEADARLLAPLGPATCATGGFVAVLVLDEGTYPEDLVRRYAAQFDAQGFPLVRPIEHRQGDGPNVFYADANTAGGGNYTAETTEVEGTIYLRLERCND